MENAITKTKRFTSFIHGERRTSFSERNNRASLTYDANEPLNATYEYGPFGELLSSSGTMATVNPFKYSIGHL